MAKFYTKLTTNNQQLITIALLFISWLTLPAQETNIYQISRGDVLSIEVMEHPEFNRPNIIVLPDGTIQYPAIGNIQVADKTPKALASEIEEVLDQEYVINPIVTVYVNRIYKESVNIFGAVNMPGRIQIYEPTELMTLISQAGGFSRIKFVTKVRVMRSDGRKETYNIKKMLKSNRDITQITLIYPEDTVIVEERYINWSQYSFFATMLVAVVQLINLFS